MIDILKSYNPNLYPPTDSFNIIYRSLAHAPKEVLLMGLMTHDLTMSIIDKLSTSDGEAYRPEYLNNIFGKHPFGIVVNRFAPDILVDENTDGGKRLGSSDYLYVNGSDGITVSEVTLSEREPHQPAWRVINVASYEVADASRFIKTNCPLVEFDSIPADIARLRAAAHLLVPDTFVNSPERVKRSIATLRLVIPEDTEADGTQQSQFNKPVPDDYIKHVVDITDSIQRMANAA